MDRILRFGAGVALAVVYFVLAVIVANVILGVSSDLAAVCFALVVIGWGALCVVAFKRDQPWIGYGILAAPFIALLVATVSCFVALNGSQI
jgi:hypothetical protein